MRRARRRNRSDFRLAQTVSFSVDFFVLAYNAPLILPFPGHAILLMRLNILA